MIHDIKSFYIVYSGDEHDYVLTQDNQTWTLSVDNTPVKIFDDELEAELFIGKLDTSLKKDRMFVQNMYVVSRNCDMETL